MNNVINSRIRDASSILERHQTLSVMGMPGAGISLFLREIAKNQPGHKLYIDIFALPELTGTELFRSLASALSLTTQNSQTEVVKACIQELERRAKQKQRVTIYFAGFDQLAPALDASLLQNLQALSRSSSGSVKLVFGLCVSLKKLIPDALFDSGLRLFGNKFYLQPYTRGELDYLLSLYGPEGWRKTPQLEQKITLSGGHFQLLMTLLSSRVEISDNLELTIPLFKNLYDHLLGPQRTIVRNIAQGKKYVLHDEYLEGVGMVTSDGKLFSPLFSSYITQLYTQRLPAKEQRLFSLLKRNLGSVVKKRVIMDAIWQGDTIGSEWALNALIYRLRRNPAFASKGYTIENYKKVGYILTKN